MDTAMPHARWALLILDITTRTYRDYGGTQALIDGFTRARLAAQGAEYPVIYTVLRFTPNYPEISDRNRQLKAVRAAKRNTAGLAGEEIHSDLQPTSMDIVVEKKRVSAFAGNELALVLRAQGVTHLALGGIATSAVVLSTVREAADRDFELAVLSDCCADPNEEVHRILLGKVYPQQADVMTSTEWVSHIRPSSISSQ
jgi:nicotinamidase-related amidase